MSADPSHRLALLARRTLALPSLPPYPTELVLSLVSSIASSQRLCDAILEPSSSSSSSQITPASHPATACLLLVHHLNMRRDKRALLAFHRVRADRIVGALWGGEDPAAVAAGQQNEASASEAEGGAAAGSVLSPEEESFCHAYQDLLATVAGKWTDVDLAGSVEPPRELFVDVRVIKEGGEVQTEYGTINLTKNSQFYVRLNDVERLIAQGFLQRLT